MSKVYTINTGNKAQFLSEYAFLSGSQITGSLLGTASYAQNADLLDGLESTVFATTGSNIFRGNNTFSGSVTIQTNNPTLVINDTDSTVRYSGIALGHLGGTWYLSNGDNTSTGTNSDFWIGRSFDSTNNRIKIARDAYTLSVFSGSSENVLLNATGLSYFNGGDVGIGTITPQTKLEVRGGLGLGPSVDSIPTMDGGAFIGSTSGSGTYPFNEFGNLILASRTNGTGRDILFYTGTTLTSRMIINRTGGVGIGTLSPTSVLEVSGSNSQGLLHLRSPSSQSAFYVSGSGNVGLGTATPQARLHINGGSLRIDDGAGNHTGFSFNTSTGLTQTNNNLVTLLGGLQVQSTAGSNSYFVGTGNVGIGLTNPTSKLHVTGSTGGIFEVDGANALNALYVSASGEVGIGTASPSNKLQIAGNVSASSYTSSISNAVGFFGTASWANNAISASFAVTSSRTTSASRADSTAQVDVLDGGSTTALGIYSGSFSGSGNITSASYALTASYALNAGGTSGVGFPYSGSAIITGSLIVSSSGIYLSGSGLTGSVFGTSSWANNAISASFATTASAATSITFTPSTASFSVTSSYVLPTGLPSGSVSSSVQVNHNTTTNYVANQHIDHTTVSISAGNGLTGGGTIAASRTLTVRYVPSTDDRATDSPPASSSAGLYADFKTNTTDGLIDGGTYHGVLTFRPYGATSDFSGGPAHQLGFTERGGLYLRTGSLNSWGPWGRFAYQTGSILGSASFATSSSFATTASFATTSSFAQTGGAVANALTFSNTGNGAATGTTYNGSVARTISYNSVGAIQGTQTAYSAITSGSSGDWFPLFAMSETTNGPVYCSINTYAHSSVSFVAIDGYGPSGFNHIVILGSVSNANGGYANISGVRITDAGIVQVRLTWTTGPLVDIDVALTCAGTPPALSANLSVDNSGTINDSVDLTTLNGYIRTENGYYGGTNLVLNANGASYLNGGSIGIGTTSPSALLHVSASGTTNDLLIGSTGSPKLFVSASGNIGVGVLPLYKVSVDGAVYASGTGGTGVSYWLDNTRAIRSTAGAGAVTYFDLGTVNFRDGNAASTGAKINVYGDGYFAGKVGIGTTAPSASLHVQGNVSASSYTSSISNAIGFVGTSSWAQNSVSSSFAISASFATTASAATSITFTPSTASFSISSSYALSSSRATSAAQVDVLGGGSTSAAGSYTGSFTGSYAGTITSASYALTASYAQNAGTGAIFPFSGSAVITGSLLVTGSGLNVSGSINSFGNILPSVDNTYNLGSPSNRWANLYTGDLVLSNEGSSGNNVDGTTGNWTIQEGDTHLYIINNKSGKKYKFVLEEIT